MIKESLSAKAETEAPATTSFATQNLTCETRFDSILLRNGPVEPIPQTRAEDTSKSQYPVQLKIHITVSLYQSYPA